MKFWDTSAILPLVVPEKHSASSEKYLQQDSRIVVWTLTPTECLSGLYRKQRESNLSPERLRMCLHRLDQLNNSWIIVQELDMVKKTAAKLLAVHPLKSADALQLAAALVAADQKMPVTAFISYDQNLRMAAFKEGLAVLG